MNHSGASRAARIALVAIVAAMGFASDAGAQDLECDPGDVEVRSLEFRGNKAVSDDDLAIRVITTPSSWTRSFGFGTRRCLDRAELPRDLLRIREYYQHRGFHRAVIDTAVTPTGPGRVQVTFTIDEGPPTILRSYGVTGLEGVADGAAILAATHVRAGRPFDIDLLAADKDTIVRRLRNGGYYRAQVFHQYQTRTDSLVADASLRVVPGVRARFGVPVIRVDSLPGRGQQIPDNVVRRLLGIEPGSLYSDRAIVDAQRALFALGTYRHIEVAPLTDSLQPPGDSIVVLSVVLNEDFMRQVDSEFGWATLDCIRLRGQYTDRNWMASARRLELTAQASKIGYGDPLANRTTRDLCDFNGRSPLAADRTFSGVLHYHLGATVRQPRLLGFRWTPAIALYTERRGEYTAYLRTTHIGADLSATRDLGFRTPIRLGYTVEYGRTTADDAALCALFNRCDPNEQTPLDTLATLGIVNASLTRVRTDNPIAPTRGYAWRAEVRSSASRLLGTSPNLFFNKGTGDLSFYRALGGNVLAMRLRAGAVVGTRTSGDTIGFVPPQERLYAGGAGSVRGFQQNELGQVVYVTARVPRDTQRVIDTVFVRISGADSVFRLQSNANTGIDRTVPLGGNSLVVLNLDYRVRDPFFFRNRLQYTFFLDAGAIGTQTSTDLQLGLDRMKWTPGVGLRMLTPVGPVQVNVGYNAYDREAGPLYFNPDVATLFCVSPDNAWEFVRRPTAENPNLLELQSTPPCRSIDARPRKGLQRLTFTFSIGSDF